MVTSSVRPLPGAPAKLKKCTHVASGETVVIKILCFKGFSKNSHGALEKFKKRGYREVAPAKNLKHTNVMSCYDGHISKRKAYILMEWMEGGSLQDYLNENGPLTQGEARNYFQQLIHGVEYCHKHLFAHLDIKPGNLLLDKTKQHLKIAEFGISNFLAADLKLSTFCGTNLYQALEIGKFGPSYRGPEVDIYSCGVTFLHLLHGSLPTLKFGKGKLDLPSTIPANASDLIIQMAAFQPKDRITITEIKNHVGFQDGDQMILDDPHGVFDQGNGINNDILLETIDKTQCEREELIQSLIKGEYTEGTTTYKLLKKKKKM